MELSQFQDMTHVAKEFVWAPVGYQFTERERAVLSRFFTNHTRKVFFVRVLPPAFIATLLSMYSRIQNPRGLRGHFVDNLLPLILASFLPQFEREEVVKPVSKFITSYGLRTLDAFVDFSPETKALFDEFLAATAIDPAYLTKLSLSNKVKKFLGLFLDQYGHNSIARMGQETLCVEQVSLLAAKSIEWSRPSSGFIELSTRFVNMAQSGLYPFWKEFALVNPIMAKRAESEANRLFVEYCARIDDTKSENSFSRFLTARYTGVVPDDELPTAVKGEVCDVLGNLLPAATLTSIGISMSGEAFQGLIRHLVLDYTPENAALAELIIKESAETGANQFLRHTNVTEWDYAMWEYFSTESYRGIPSGIHTFTGPDKMLARAILEEGGFDFGKIKDVLEYRGPYDKLPRAFEGVSVVGRGAMSFRGWRDAQRQTFCTHRRTYLTPHLGFYRYDKPAPREFFEACEKTHVVQQMLYQHMDEHRLMSNETMQYPLAIGHLVGFSIGGNLRQLEFCGWQRSKHSVNHEVRQVFLALEKKLRVQYPWWEVLSRVDLTPAYCFARTKEGIPFVPAVSAEAVVE